MNNPYEIAPQKNDFSFKACVLFIDCICLGVFCMLLVDTGGRPFMRDEVLKENIFQPETCTEWLDEEVSYTQNIHVLRKKCSL